MTSVITSNVSEENYDELVGIIYGTGDKEHSYLAENARLIFAGPNESALEIILANLAALRLAEPTWQFKTFIVTP